MRIYERDRYLNPWPMFDRLWPQMHRQRDFDARVGRVGAMPCFTSRYKQMILADAPTAYWIADETSGHFIDATGHGYDSTTETTITYNQRPTPFRDGLSPYAVKGSGGVASRANPDTVTNNMCFEIWVQFVSGVGSNRSVCSNTGSLKGWDIITTSATKLAVVVQNVAIQANCAATIITGPWYHIVFGKDTGSGGAWKYYINGALDTASAGTGNPIAPTSSTYGVGVGGTALVFNWNHFAYYSTALLTATQVANHFKAAVEWPF